MLQMCCEMKRCASFKKRLTSSMSSKITRSPVLRLPSCYDATSFASRVTARSRLLWVMNVISSASRALPLFPQFPTYRCGAPLGDQSAEPR
jgi:hypothetical protein